MASNLYRFFGKGKEQVLHEQKTRKAKVLLIGRTGAGKSAFGNLLLGREEFKSEPGLTSITGKSCIAYSEDYNLCVIDTPGLSDAAEAFDNVEALKEIAKGILLVVQDGDPGVDVILFVISAAVRFTRDEQNVLRYFESMKNFWPYVLPVFTNIDALDKDEPDKFILESLKNPRAPIGLQKLIENVKDRFVAVHSTSSDLDYRNRKRNEVLTYINEIRKQNKYKRYTNDMFKNALKVLKPTSDSQGPNENTMEPELGEEPVDTDDTTMPSTANPSDKMESSVDPNPIVESPITEQQISEDVIKQTMEDIKQRAQELKTMEEECFPGDSTVITKDGIKFMHEINPGDEVLAVTPGGSTIFSEVVTFLHYEPKTFATYINIQTTSGTLFHVSSNHLVFSVTPDVAMFKSKAVMASCIKLGDYILEIKSPSSQIQSTQVTSIDTVRKQGVYAPMTQCGTIVVDSALASCYASYPSHSIAHAVMAPLRIYYNITKHHRHGVPVTEGINSYAAFLYKLIY